MNKKIIALLLVVLLLFATGCEKKSADDYYKSANEYVSKGDNLKAAVDFVKAYQIDSKMVLAYIGAIDAYKELNIEFRIKECLQLLIENCPDDPTGYMLAIEYYYDKGDISSALDYCFLEIDAIPTIIDGYKMATKIYYEAESFENSLKYANQIVELFPDDYDGYCYTIQCLNLLSRNPEAISVSNSMIKVFPDEVIPYVFLGYIHLEDENYLKATAAIDRCPDQEDSRITSLRRTIHGKEVIEITDPALEIALRYYLDKKTDAILLEDVFDISYLDIVGGRNPKVVFNESPAPLDIPVEFLDDLMYFESLLGLKIRTLELEDYTPIELLSDLCILSFDNTNVSDLSFIKNLPYIVALSITNGTLTDISPIASLKYLEELYLDNNEITTLYNFSEQTSLSQLSLSHNQLNDITLLSYAANLIKLDLSENKELSSVKPLATLAYLSYLNLLGCNIEDIKYVLTVPNLLYG